MRSLLISLMPLTMLVLAVVYAPGTTAKILTVWSFLMGGVFAMLVSGGIAVLLRGK